VKFGDRDKLANYRYHLSMASGIKEAADDMQLTNSQKIVLKEIGECLEEINSAIGYTFFDKESRQFISVMKSCKIKMRRIFDEIDDDGDDDE